MAQHPALTVRSCPPAPEVLAVLLHPPGAAAAACELARAWRPAVPAADVTTLSVPEGRAGTAVSALLARRLDRARLDTARLVMAGVYGAEGTALQLAFGEGALGCAGVLACGGALPLLEPLGAPARSRTRLRLVWEADNPLSYAAALGGLLHRFRAAGLDAQGAVLGREGGPPAGSYTGRGPSPALVRLGGAYLAELVAVALGAAPRFHAERV
jgi:hypothetical protein